MESSGAGRALAPGGSRLTARRSEPVSPGSTGWCARRLRGRL